MDAAEILSRVETATESVAQPLRSFADGMNGRFDRQMALNPNLLGLRNLHSGLRGDVQSARIVATALFKDAQNALRDTTAVVPDVMPVRSPEIETAAIAELSDMIESGFGSFAVGIARNFRERLLGGPAAAALSDRVHVRNGSRMHMSNFVNLTVRRAILDHVNSARISNMMAIGAESAFIRHPDPGHEFNGVSIRLAEVGEGYSYAELQAAGAFHPQSKSIVVLN